MVDSVRVSIVTPCYNNERTVAQTIASVRAQTFTAWEHVVVDDGSTDRSADIVAGLVAEEPRLHLVCQPNRGVAAARNRGYAECGVESEYLLFLDADDCIEPTMLAEMVAYLDAHPQVGMLHCDLRYIDAEGNDLGTELPEIGPFVRYGAHDGRVRPLSPAEPETPFFAIFAPARIIPSVTLLRRSVYARTPGWDEQFGQPCEDTHLFLHVALLAPVHFLPARLLRYRIHAGQASRGRKIHLQKQKLYALWHGHTDLPPAAQAQLREAFRLREGQLLPIVGMAEARRNMRCGHYLTALRCVLGSFKRRVRASWA